jgi:hypothetical protein
MRADSVNGIASLTVVSFVSLNGCFLSAEPQKHGRRLIDLVEQEEDGPFIPRDRDGSAACGGQLQIPKVKY